MRKVLLGFLLVVLGIIGFQTQAVNAAVKITSTSISSPVDAALNLKSLVKTSYASNKIQSVTLTTAPPVLAAPQNLTIGVKVIATDRTVATKTIALHVVANYALKQRANMIYFLQSAVPYIKGNMTVTKAPALTAQTWGGNVLFSGTDHQNTQFIGHNPGVFVQNKLLKVGNALKVTDAANRAFTYHVDKIAVVNALGYTQAGVDLYPSITERGNAERIVLQSSVNASDKLIVFAH
ncbi:hypothetical protein [Lacticaseibacillus porcinae]|uniref:hypothetical protein n=1 Tax=Lacticaseibacillus porcinae TaxID=1123687 RepID=UPI000F7AB427|nr:hypothetical protein [Lacticaseibacillus porcinae]